MASNFNDRKRGRTTIPVREISLLHRSSSNGRQRAIRNERIRRSSLMYMVFIYLGCWIIDLILSRRSEDYSDRMRYLDSIYDLNPDREGGGL
jgi:hypothetical protein